MNDIPWAQLFFENIVLWASLILGLWEISKLKGIIWKIMFLVIVTIAYDAYRLNDLTKMERLKGVKDFYAGLTEDAYEKCPECMNKTYTAYLNKRRKGAEIDKAAEGLNSPEKITAGSDAVTGVSP